MGFILWLQFGTSMSSNWVVIIWWPVLKEQAYWPSNSVNLAKYEVEDIPLTYFGGHSIKIGKEFKKVYRVNSVSNDNSTSTVSEIRELNGITFERIKLLREDRKRSGEAFKKYVNKGQYNWNW